MARILRRIVKKDSSGDRRIVQGISLAGRDRRNSVTDIAGLRSELVVQIPHAWLGSFRRKSPVRPGLFVRHGSIWSGWYLNVVDHRTRHIETLLYRVDTVRCMPSRRYRTASRRENADCHVVSQRCPIYGTARRVA